MRKIDSACVTVTTDSHIKFEEKKKSIVFRNKNQHKCSKVVVDGCAIKDGVKCDNLLVDMTNNNEYFVELKGEDVSHAICQLQRSVTLLSDQSVKDKDISAFIIGMSVICKKNSLHMEAVFRERKDTLESGILR